MNLRKSYTAREDGAEFRVWRIGTCGSRSGRESVIGVRFPIICLHDRGICLSIFVPDKNEPYEREMCRSFRRALVATEIPTRCATEFMRGATETGGFVRRDIVALRYGTEYRRETVWRYEVRQWHRMNSYSMSRRGISSIRPRYRVLRNDYASIVLKKNVWIVSNATILSGVTIGESVVVTAGAVVTKNVLERAIVGGVPARVIRTI